MNKQPNSGKQTVVVISLMFMLIVSIAAWMTYRSVEGIWGILSFVLVGILCILPWVVPFFVGAIVGILNLLGILSFNVYSWALQISGVEQSWMTSVWVVFMSTMGFLLGLYLTYEILATVKGLKFRKKETAENIALTNCHIIDGKADSEVVSNGVILIKNVIEKDEIPGIITAVGTAGEIDIPSGYKEVDLNGKYVLPGLINAHCHLFSDGKPMKMVKMSDSTKERISELLKLGFIQRIFKRKMIVNINNALNAGVTTIRTLGDPEGLDLAVREEVKGGRIHGPRMICAGSLIAPTGGHGGPVAQSADGIVEVSKTVRKLVRKEVDVIKISSTGGVMDAKTIGEAGRPQMTAAEIEAACFEAHRGGLMVATHCQSSQGIRDALDGGVDTIEHGADIPDELVAQFKNNPKAKRGYTSLVPTIAAGMGLVALPIEQTHITPIVLANGVIILKGQIKGLQNAYKSGIKIGIGTDAAIPYSTHYLVWKELEYFMKYTGMTAREAISTATKGTAEVLGIDGITGTIEIGKSADIQVVDGNPWEDIGALGKVISVVCSGTLIRRPKISKLKTQVDFAPFEV
ncbi:MAG: amidohydrolase family protein [Proteobacteria bacterium]|nr:amidohydrolase family protein [Pseudomonadota bacterium]